jgi:hypothetical protein
LGRHAELGTNVPLTSARRLKKLSYISATGEVSH